MIGVSQVRETREHLIARARRSMQMAEAETLPNRARVHIAAAETWLRLAERKVKRERFAAVECEDVASG
ncbi:hypothetical protein [Sphingomonas colocasiae]|uniref:Uncharacterized protein n=1 Tax=Sphingomonas colocasiae TaxID=1848973 RepID=A0ABS7PQC9_9SPHN|nr:hypothetical protein [Sphingomonas colocasiae]MBY8823396.1 hypothetical protein [Sphingomonas colocasiae]